MAKTIMKNPFFARASTYSVLENSVQNGLLKKLDRIAYVYVLDTKILYYVDAEHTIRSVVGDNPIQVKRVTTLPSTSEGDDATIYLLGTVGYTFSGGAYHPLFEDIQDDLDTLNTTVSELVSNVSSLTTEVSALTSAVATIQENYNALSTKVETMETDISTLQTEQNNMKNDISSVQSDVQSVQTSLATKANANDVYTKSEVDEKVGSIGSGVTVVEYVQNSQAEAVETANSYTDEKISLIIV